MKATSRFLLSGMVLLVAVGCVVASRPAWVPLLNRGMMPQSGKSVSLIAAPDERIDLTQQRIRARIRIVHHVQSGEMSLFLAAAWFRFLNETPYDKPDPVRTDIRGATSEERLCRQVILWLRVEMEATTTFSQAAPFIQNLEDELEDHKCAHHGRVVLPELTAEG